MNSTKNRILGAIGEMKYPEEVTIIHNKQIKCCELIKVGKLDEITENWVQQKYKNGKTINFILIPLETRKIE